MDSLLACFHCSSPLSLSLSLSHLPILRLFYSHSYIRPHINTIFIALAHTYYIEGLILGPELLQKEP